MTKAQTYFFLLFVIHFAFLNGSDPQLNEEFYFDQVESYQQEDDEDIHELNGEWKQWLDQITLVTSDLDALLEEEKDVEERKCEELATSETDWICSSLDDLQNEINLLKSKVDSFDNEFEIIDDNIEVIRTQPDPALLVDNNFVIVGTTDVRFRLPSNKYNHTFDFVTDPVFLWRFKDYLLYELKLDFRIRDCGTATNVIYSTIDYVYNDCLTIRAGKFSTPLGMVWEKMTTGWINKLPTLPAPYVPRKRILLPPAEIGLDLRGAIPIGWVCRKDNVGTPMVMAYDIWVGNGPAEGDYDIDLACNGFDNNNNVSFGGRLSFRPVPYRVIAISTTLSRWNSNFRDKHRLSSHALWYSAIVLDWNWGLTDSSKLMGEFIWTRHDTVENKKKGIPKCHATEIGGWLQYSTFFDKWCCGKFKKWEGVVRYSFVESDIRDATRRQLAIGLNYHINDILILKTAYNLNHGHLYPSHEFIIQLAHAY